MFYTFEYPYFLLLLPLLFCFIFCKRVVIKCYLPKVEWIPKVSRFINIQTLLKVSIYSLVVFALASPIAYDAITPSKKYGRDIVLTLDTSGSMKESGFSDAESSKSKFEIVQEIVASFIDKRQNDNLGVVAFGTFAFTATPVTYDHQSLKTLLHMLEVEIAGKNTAIGEGIVQSIATLKHAEAKNQLIILLTDGIQNSGKVSIKEAVGVAKEKGIKIYTIGLGREKEFDLPLLQKIASQTDAKSFVAQNNDQLQAVYQEIDRLNPSVIRSEQYRNKSVLFIYPLGLATLLMFWFLARKEGLL
ncbi:MAG: VWA domain-containing protein [Epsilonproteobacteria bacterium]|nr:VWA domain-containing protein [Campylobacterota bacterium]